MAQESLQKKLSRVRPPRVHITYDVEIGDAIEKRELPFVVGVLADLSGHVAKDRPLPHIRDRKFVEVDRDNFDKVRESIEPRLQLKVANRLSEDDSQLGVELKFHSMDEFEPAKVAGQVPAVRKLLEARRALANLRASLIGNEKAELLLQEVLGNTEKLQRITSEEGFGPGSSERQKQGEES